VGGAGGRGRGRGGQWGLGWEEEGGEGEGEEGGEEEGGGWAAQEWARAAMGDKAERPRLPGTVWARSSLTLTAKELDKVAR